MEKEIKISALLIGISSLLIQLVFIRESLSLFSGNEITLGIIFSIWLLLTGLGCWSKKFFKLKKGDLVKFLLLLSYLPLILIFLMRYARAKFFIYGATLNPFSVFLLSLLISPFCFISGLSLLFLVSLDKKGERGKIYWLDSIGDLLGTLIFTLLLIFYFNSFKFILINSFLLLSFALFISYKSRKKLFLIFSLILLSLSFFLLFFDIDKYSLSFLYKNQEIVYARDSLYGKLVVTKSKDQLNFFENFILLFSTGNYMNAEEIVHYPMVQHKNPKEILLLSGGISGTLEELLKYNPESIDYVEIDPEILKVGKIFGRIPSSKKINLISTDARLYVRNARKKYDVVIVDLPDFSTLQLNRLYTLEFFKEVKRILKKDGIFSTSISSHENYLSPESRKINSILFNTLKKVFKEVIIIPGQETFFIASDSNLTYEIGKRIAERNISTVYVNENYLSGKLTKERIEYVLKSIEKGAGINKDLEPIAYYHFLNLWTSQFNLSVESVLAFFLFLLFLFSLFLKLRPISLAIFTTGISASSLELLLLFLFQVAYGYLYSLIGLLTFTFMLGISVGSFFATRRIEKRIWIVEFSIFLFSFIIFLFLKLFLQFPFLIPFSLFILGFLTGFEFPLASHLEKEINLLFFVFHR